MKSMKLKTALLAGSALVVFGFAGAAQAANEFSVNTNDSVDSVYETTPVNTPLDLTTHTTHDIRFDGGDGAGGTIAIANGETIGDADSTAAGIVGAAGANGLTLTISSQAESGASQTVTITNGIALGASTGFNLTIAPVLDTVADGSENLIVDVNGAINLGTGTLTLASNDGDGDETNTVDLLVSGNITAATIVLDVDADGGGAIASDATLTLDGTAAGQTIAAAINGGAAGEGDIVVSNTHADGVTFTGIIGATGINGILVSNNGSNVSATFTSNVTTTAAGIVMGNGAGTDTNTVTFNAATAAGGNLVVAGIVNGTAGDTDRVVIAGGANKVSNTGIWGGNSALDLLTINATSELETGAAVLAVDAVINAAGVLDLNTGNFTVTNNISFAGAGTIEVADGINIVTGGVANTSGTAGVGTITFEGDSVVQNLGVTASLATINANGIAGKKVQTGTIAATTVNFGADGTLEVSGATYTAATTTSTTNTGTLEFDAGGAVTATGQIGVATTGLLKNVLVSGANTVVSQTGHIFATNITFDSDTAGLTMADNSNITAAVVAAVAGDGDLNFTGSSTVTGSLGVVGANELDLINFNGDNTETVAITGNVAATDIKWVGATTVTVDGDIEGALDFDANGSLTLAAGHAITGSVVNSTDSFGTLAFAAAGTVAGNIGADGNELAALTLSGSATTVTVTGAVQAADNTTIGTNLLAIAGGGGTFDTDANQTLRFSITDGTTYGRITAGAAATVDADTNIVLTVASNAYIADATDFTFIDGTGGVGVVALTAGKITDDSAVLTFAQQNPAGADLVIRATRVAMNTLTSGNNGNTGTVGAVLDALGAGGDADLDAIQVTLQNSATNAELNTRLEAMLPTVDSGAQAGAALSVTNSTIGIIDARTGGSGSAGIASGNFGSGAGMWFKGFGTMMDQGRRDGIAGYEADTYGGSVGIDTDGIIDNAIVGLAFTYASTEVDSDNANSTNSEIDTYQIALYGQTGIIDDRSYLSGTIGYGWNDIEQVRYNVAGVAGNNARADFDSDTFFARTEIGRDYQMDRTMTLTPSILANYAYLDTDSYSETGSTANLAVQSSDMSIFELGVGLDAKWDIVNRGGSVFKPEISVGYRYDFVGDEIETTAAFTGGGAAFSTKGADAAQGTYNAGLGFTLETTSGWDLSAAYMYEGKDEFDAHNAHVQARFNF